MSKNDLPLSILFCCDHNAIRSPIAEGLMKKKFGTLIYVQSVGVESEREIDGFAITVCKEIDVELSRHQVRNFDEMEALGDHMEEFDIVVALSRASHIKVMKLVGASSTYIRLPFIFEAIFESLLGTSIAVGLGWGLIQYSKDSVVAESIFDITISDTYLINLTLGLILTSIIFGLFASYIGIRKALNE